jgi:uncharacterized protein
VYTAHIESKLRMNYTEEALRFSCAGDRLLGIVARPEVTPASAFVLVVGGPQYRAGSHRQFVVLSRRLASAGHAVLRFDYRGMGDSEGQQQSFDQVSLDIAAAMDALQQQLPSVRHIALWGLCDGASAALLYCHDSSDPRVRALCLLNPWVRSTTSLARTQVRHYYVQRLGQKDFWHKLLRGAVSWRALQELMQNARAALARSSPQDHSAPGERVDLVPTFQQRMASAWQTFPGAVMLILSENDYTAKEFMGCLKADPAWSNALLHPRLMRHDLPNADHTFSTASARMQVEVLTLALGQALQHGSKTLRPGHTGWPHGQLGPPPQGHIRAPI